MPVPATGDTRQSRLRPRRRTVRLRLTLLYGGLFLASGAGVLAVNYVLVAARFPGRYLTTAGHTDAAGSTIAPSTSSLPDGPKILDTSTDLHQLLIQSGIALAVMTVAALGLGWLMAGRILRPLRTMTAATRHISEKNLHQRLAMSGPADELKDLADTVDELLARLESAFDAQRRFVANASHELRTPLTVERALIEVALADPAPTVESLRSTFQDVLAAGQQQERLIEALLTLARSQHDLHHREPVDLAATTAAMLELREPEARRRKLHIRDSLQPARALGNPRLAERLVANLLDNALRYNVPGGRVDVATTTRTGRATLSVVNTGPPVPADQIDRLLQPFQRLPEHRSADGIGLGLSIVAAVAKAHHADLTAHPAPGGGLHIEVSFPDPDTVTKAADAPG
jgi:signal transduction histidine kinase